MALLHFGLMWWPWCCLPQVVYRDPVRYKLQKTLTVAPEGMYSGQVCSEHRCSRYSNHCSLSSIGSCTQPAQAEPQMLQHGCL